MIQLLTLSLAMYGLLGLCRIVYNYLDFVQKRKIDGQSIKFMVNNPETIELYSSRMLCVFDNFRGIMLPIYNYEKNEHLITVSTNGSDTITDHTFLDSCDDVKYINTNTELENLIQEYNLDLSRIRVVLPLKLTVSQDSDSEELYYATVRATANFGANKSYSSHSLENLIRTCAMRKRLPFTFVSLILSYLLVVFVG